MILFRETNVLGRKTCAALAHSAEQQTFYEKDPRGRPDHGMRDNVRSATVCYEWSQFEPWWNLIRSTLTRAVYQVRTSTLRNPENPEKNMQLTRMVAGDYFAMHTDAGYVHGPVVSFVYYLAVPLLMGGELFFDGITIEPEQDSLVVFDGLQPHGINRLQVPSEKDYDFGARLTINGYFS